MEALSLSTVIRLCSGLMVSPTLTINFDDGHFGEVADVGNFDYLWDAMCLSLLLLST